MNLSLDDAIMCAALILQGAGIDLKMPTTLSEFQQRPVSQREIARADVPDNTLGLFYPLKPRGVVVADNWEILVHEATHELEFANHLPLREDWAYFAQARAYDCSFRWQTDCPADETSCWVATYTPR